MKKKDLILLFVIAMVLLALFLLRGSSQDLAGEVVITSHSEPYGTYALSQNRQLRIETADGHYNDVVIQDGQVTVIEADCSNQLCVRQGSITRTGESIICLPHQLVVTITGMGDAGYDSVVQ